MNKTLYDYCRKKKINIEDLASIVNITTAQLYLIANNPSYNITINSINKIYKGTKKEFGKGLVAQEYLNFECLKK